MRDLPALLKPHKCWDTFTEFSYNQWSAPDNCILQSRDELTALCGWIESHQIKSYLEIGCWTGKLVNLLHHLFEFEKVAACDLGLCEKYLFDIHLGEGIQFFKGDSHSPEFRQWREDLGHFDLIFLDGDHTAAGLRADMLVNLEAGCGHIAIHDISSGLVGTEEVAPFWQSLPGPKEEFLLAHSEIGLNSSKTGIGIIPSSPELIAFLTG